MGMFDTVMVPCPSCGTEAGFQSKGGACVLATLRAERDAAKRWADDQLDERTHNRRRLAEVEAERDAAVRERDEARKLADDFLSLISASDGSCLAMRDERDSALADLAACRAERDHWETDCPEYVDCVCGSRRRCRLTVGHKEDHSPVSPSG